MANSLNIAIGLQIVIGSLITGLAAVTTGRQTSITTSILGAFSTIIASFLARMRGTGEPDRSKASARGFDRYVRACDAYLVDHADEPGRDPAHMERIKGFREEFEQLEGSLNAEQQGQRAT